MGQATWYGANAPFWGGPQSVLSNQTDEKLIKNDIVQLIMTIPGERVYRPDFGTPLRAVVFENLLNADLNTLSSDINQAIVDNEERVIVNDVICALIDNGQGINVRIDLTPISHPLTQYLIDISINQNGSITLSK